MLDIGNMTLNSISEVARYQFEIEDITEDRNLKTLLLLSIFGIKAMPSRQRQDAYDHLGNYYQAKTTTGDEFSTSHHLSISILDNSYRMTDYWIFGVFLKGTIELKEVYVVLSIQLEPWFKLQEERLRREGKSFLNDPKIRLSLVKKIGLSLDLTTIADKSTKEILEMAETNENERLRNQLLLTSNQILERQERSSGQLAVMQQDLTSQKDLLSKFIENIEKVLHSSFIDDALNKAKASVAAQTTLSTVEITPQLLNNSPPRIIQPLDNVACLLPSIVPHLDIEEERMTKYLTSEFFIINPGDITKFVSGHTITRYWRIWHQMVYGCLPRGQRNAFTSGKVYAKLGLQRKEDKLFGLEQRYFHPKNWIAKDPELPGVLS